MWATLRQVTRGHYCQAKDLSASLLHSLVLADDNLVSSLWAINSLLSRAAGDVHP